MPHAVPLALGMHLYMDDLLRWALGGALQVPVCVCTCFDRALVTSCPWRRRCIQQALKGPHRSPPPVHFPSDYFAAPLLSTSCSFLLPTISPLACCPAEDNGPTGQGQVVTFGETLEMRGVALAPTTLVVFELYLAKAMVAGKPGWEGGHRAGWLVRPVPACAVCGGVLQLMACGVPRCAICRAAAPLLCRRAVHKLVLLPARFNSQTATGNRHVPPDCAHNAVPRCAVPPPDCLPPSQACPARRTSWRGRTAPL